jgi:outer membrane protein
MKKIIFIAALLGLAIVGNAQKIGHMNSGNLLSTLPEVAKADTGLVLYQKDLMLTGDTLAKAFEKEYKVFVEAYNAGTLSQQQVQKRQAELQKVQQTLQNYAQEVDQRVANLRRQLLQPVLTKLDEAIRAVAKENGYSFIFDTSTGNSLFAAESDDVTALVKRKLESMKK